MPPCSGSVPPLHRQVVRHPQIHQRLLSIMGDMVARERAGEIVDRALLRATTQVRACGEQRRCATSARRSDLSNMA